MRRYETIYIAREDVPEEQVQSINGKLQGIIEGAQGKIIRIESWGKKPLAYKIKSGQKGSYIFLDYMGNPGLVNEVERSLKHTEEVIRYHSFKVAESGEAGSFTGTEVKEGEEQGDAGQD